MATMASTAPSSSTAGSSSFHTLSPSSSLSLLPRRRDLSIHPQLVMCAPLQAITISSRTSDNVPTWKTKLRPETGLQVVLNCSGLVLPSVKVNMHIKGNGAMLNIAGYSQGARGLAAAARSESREETNEVNLEDVKKALIRAVASTNRGKNASFEQRKSILDMINELENANPTKNPVKSPLLSGYWSLLYTAPIDESKSDKYAGTQEGPFLARIKPLAFGSIRQTRSSQVIDVEGGIAKNIADFTFLGKDGTLTIKGNAAPSPINGKETIRLDVVFEEFSVRIGRWTSPNVSLQWINPQGWVDTTFLDKDMRVGRGDKGSVFLSVRVKM